MGGAIEAPRVHATTYPGNWKLMFENIKDPYHASLLHVFLVTFGSSEPINPSKVQVDKTGRHGA